MPDEEPPVHRRPADAHPVEGGGVEHGTRADRHHAVRTATHRRALDSRCNAGGLVGIGCSEVEFIGVRGSGKRRTLLTSALVVRTGGDRLQCIGTSATLAGPGSRAEQRDEVAALATRLFGTSRRRSASAPARDVATNRVGRPAPRRARRLDRADVRSSRGRRGSPRPPDPHPAPRRVGPPRRADRR